MAEATFVAYTVGYLLLLLTAVSSARAAWRYRDANHLYILVFVLSHVLVQPMQRFRLVQAALVYRPAVFSPSPGRALPGCAGSPAGDRDVRDRRGRQRIAVFRGPGDNRSQLVLRLSHRAVRLRGYRVLSGSWPQGGRDGQAAHVCRVRYLALRRRLSRAPGSELASKRQPIWRSAHAVPRFGGSDLLLLRLQHPSGAANGLAAHRAGEVPHERRLTRSR